VKRRAWTCVGAALVVLFFASFGPGLVIHDLNAADSQPFAERLALITGFSGFQLVGALIISRRPEHPIGWLFSAVALLAASGFTAGEYSTYALVTKPGSLPAGLVAGWFASWLWYPTVVLAVIYVPLLFPDGRLPSPRWRCLAYACGIVLAAICISYAFAPNLDAGPDEAAGVANPVAIGPIEGVLDVVLAVGFPALLAAVALTALSVALRFRGSRGDARQQLKWFAAGVMLLSLSIPAGEISSAAGSFAFAVGLLVLPSSVAVAILRYRLYDIDLVINRTLVYGALSAILGAGYVASVVVLQAALGSFTSGDQLEIAIATLLVAAAFRPLRNAIQRFIDRRFYRRRYDAQRTIAAFAARLRDEVELEAISADLVSVVDRTVQPAGTSLWLRGMAKTREARTR